MVHQQVYGGSIHLPHCIAVPLHQFPLDHLEKKNITPVTILQFVIVNYTHIFYIAFSGTIIFISTLFENSVFLNRCNHDYFRLQIRAILLFPEFPNEIVNNH